MTESVTQQPPAAGPQFAIPPGYWQREASHNPRPLTPLGYSLFNEGANQAFPKVFADFGLLLETLEFRNIGGYVYTSARPFGAPVGDGGGRMPPRPLLWLALRLHPAFRRRIAACKKALRGRLDRTLIERWYSEWRPGLVADMARLRAIDLASLSDAQLAAHFEELRRWFDGACDVHFYLSGANGFPLARLAFFCRDRLGYDDMRTLSLMSGLSGASSAPAIALAQLADRLRADDVLRPALLDAKPADVPAIIGRHGGDAAAAFRSYLDEYGYRALRYEVVERTLGEEPQIVGQLLQDQLRRPVDVRAEQERLRQGRDEAKAAVLAALPGEALRARFLDLLADAERAYPVREDNEFYTVSVPLAICRFAAIEAARRLVASGAIALPDDVFFLTWEEVGVALRAPSEAFAGLVAERRAAFAAAEAFAPPATYGVEPPPPPMGVLPPVAREAMEVMLYIQDNVFEAEMSGARAGSGETEIRGRAAAKGTRTGTARIVMGEHEFDKLQPGDVLVCPITSPVWSVLFAKVSALVTDTGGILSHPAIIAREYGIPAVVATGNATQLIRDGQQVLVDGDAGIVRILT
jgi:pyruvate,water dikinase